MSEVVQTKNESAGRAASEISSETAGAPTQKLNRAVDLEKAELAEVDLDKVDLEKVDLEKSKLKTAFCMVEIKNCLNNISLREFCLAQEIKTFYGNAKSERGAAQLIAAKQAIAKLLELELAENTPPKAIEIYLNSNKRHCVTLSGEFAQKAAFFEIVEVLLSLTYTRTHACALVAAITKDAKLALKSKVDPQKELLKQFKEAKQLLGEINSQRED